MTYEPSGIYCISPDGLGKKVVSKKIVSTYSKNVVSVSINYDDDTLCRSNYGK